MNKIYVGNLSYRITETELENYFSEYGPILNIHLIKDRETGRLKGFGFIEFESKEAANAAVQADGKELLGRAMKVSIAKERKHA